MVRGGPISLAEYMQDCLTSPAGGFYMSRDVFGSAGDFVTSPEISQMFGEMVGIWCVHTWMEMGRPPRLQLVELGPGRGTLMADLLRGTSAFRDFSRALEVHLVEMSPALRAMQWRALRCEPAPAPEVRLPAGPGAAPAAAGGAAAAAATAAGKAARAAAVAAQSEEADLQYLRSGMPPLVGQQQQQQQQQTLHHQQKRQQQEQPQPVERQLGPSAAGVGESGSAGAPQAPSTPAVGVSGFNGCRVHWHATLDAVPDGPSPALYVAHEFFDALPVHQFVRDPERGWLEKMVDVEHPEEEEGHEGGVGKASDVGAGGMTAAAAAAVRDGGQGAGGAGATALPGAAVRGSGSAGRGAGAAGAGPAHSTSGSGLRLVLSPGPTPAAALLVPRRLAGLAKEQAEGVNELEVSAVGMATAERLAQRIGRHGGAALVVDYGREAPPYGDSLMAIRAHRGVGVLDRPGTADLSAWVDFGALRQAAAGAGGPVSCSGPATQAAFLLSLGLEARLGQLVAAAQAADGGSGGGGGGANAVASALVEGARRLVDTGEGGMGRSYQVMAIHHSSLRQLAGL
ncbi:hypothetical protein GPECTOR_102g43 [Gonium pectorale]|uniref:Protein arginine methyltransferase NDUFAF7 n=1 Tax=Gonium pectorale TaxID=33097 RepID=A0A150G1C6_GONPE|nr:hypothetical protein GPECTOR_102g43 [Gonium pectorale]|eukprot:KXZ43090.1 hypothetical protein GPECTOR_102g43 [Gonium pectorale]